MSTATLFEPVTIETTVPLPPMPPIGAEIVSYAIEGRNGDSVRVGRMKPDFALRCAVASWLRCGTRCKLIAVAEAFDGLASYMSGSTWDADAGEWGDWKPF